MIHGATSVGTAAAEGRKAAMTASSSGDDFMMVLKNSAGNAQTSSESSRSSAVDNSDRPTDEAATAGDKVKNGAANEKTETRNSDDAVIGLAHNINRITEEVRQIMNNPQPKDASAMLNALTAQDSGSSSSLGLESFATGQDIGVQMPGSGIELQAMIGANGAALSEISDTKSQNVQFELSSQQNGEGKNNNSTVLFGQLTGNATTAAGKPGNMNNGSGSAFQDTDGAFQFELGKDVEGATTGAMPSQNVDTFDEALAQFKTGAVTGREGDIKDSGSAAGIYSQSIQSQDASLRSTQHVQETIPANKMSTVDGVIAKAVNTGQQDIVIRIDPPDLGSLHIRLSLDNGVLRADVRVDSAAVKDSFLAAMPQIKNALENTGIKVSDFHVDVRDDQDNSGQSGNNHAKHQQRRDGEAKNAFSDFFA
jgi:flagellar hook-length control protein FliK